MIADKFIIVNLSDIDMGLLDIDKVSKHFGGIEANKAISMKIDEGKIVGLIGPNGSGKTTLFNSVVGAHKIDCGDICFAGQDITSLRSAEIARLGLLRTFQQPRVYPKLSVADNMRLSSREVYGSIFRAIRPFSQSVDQRLLELLSFVGLSSKSNDLAGSLSFGQQKLLEFAMALMNEAKLLLLDEPTAGINPTLINSLIDRLKRATIEYGVSLLIIEHNMRVIMNIAEKIYCLAHGSILAQGTPNEIVNHPKVIDAYLGAA